MHGEREEMPPRSVLGEGTKSETPADAAPKHGGKRPGAGRKSTHGLRRLRAGITQLTTRRLDGRTVIAREVRRWKEDVRADLGGDLTRAQETILEAVADFRR